jgi:lipid A 4'-phosphatase
MTLIEVPARAEAPSWAIVWAACCLGLGGAILFAAFPQIDRGITSLFYLGDNKFLFGRDTTGNVMRELVRWIFILMTIGAVIGFAGVAFASRRLFGLGFAAWVYILLTVGLGAGLVANVVFKDQWGRARPNQVVEFGGTKQFTAPLTRTNQCEKNCSFVSGEASSIFAIGFAIALIAEVSRRRRLLIAAIAAGSFAGLLRIGGGGHFFSDVFFAGIFMAIVARGVYWLLFERFEFWFADEGPLHRRTLYAGRRGGEHAVRLMERARELKLMERARQSRLMERARRMRRKEPPAAP